VETVESDQSHFWREAFGRADLARRVVDLLAHPVGAVRAGGLEEGKRALRPGSLILERRFWQKGHTVPGLRKTVISRRISNRK
jgi:hypothetical protein